MRRRCATPGRSGRPHDVPARAVAEVPLADLERSLLDALGEHPTSNAHLMLAMHVLRLRPSAPLLGVLVDRVAEGPPQQMPNAKAWHASLTTHVGTLLEESAELSALAAAHKAARRKEKGAEKARVAAALAPVSSDGTLAALLASLEATSDDRAIERARLSRIEKLRKELFPGWQPYPKKRPSEVTGDARAFLEWAAAHGHAYELQYAGLFQRKEDNARFLGSPRGPSDVEVPFAGSAVPLWWLVTAVASGHADGDAALAAFASLASLSPDDALGAWTEIARGEAYDLWEAHALTSKEAGIPKTPRSVKHWTRLLEWMARASVELGPAGKRAAEALAAACDTSFATTMDAFVACAALSAHGALTKRDEPLVASLTGPGARVFADPVVKAIAKRGRDAG